jgi:mannose-1-phosphate guanylyltransferase
LWEASSKDPDGNVVRGDVITSGVSGSYLRSDGRRLAVAGVDNVVVVETPDAVLVLGLDRAQDVRHFAAPPPQEDQGV